MSMAIFFGTMALAVLLALLWLKYGFGIAEAFRALGPFLYAGVAGFLFYYGAMVLPLRLSQNYTKQQYVAEISELENFSAEHMFAAMTTKPKGEGILTCGYVDKWNAFAIRFSENSDRFYVYLDFPKDAYSKMLNSSDPYSYYKKNIRGQYGEAERYPIPEVSIYGTIEF